MSQEITYPTVMTVSEEVQFQRVFAPILVDILNTAPIEVKAGVKKCIKSRHSKSSKMLAPSELKVIQSDYENYTVEAKQQNIVKADQLKVAALATMVSSQDNLIMSNPSEVAAKIHHIVEATTVADVKREIASAFKEIKGQHSQMFVANLTEVVRGSAVEVGFNEVTVKVDSGMVRVVGTNHIGQNLITEISTNDTTELRAELVGFSDGSCEKVMRSFENALASRGVTAKDKKQKATNGIPQMNYAKKLVKARRNQRTFSNDTITNLDTTETISKIIKS